MYVRGLNLFLEWYIFVCYKSSFKMIKKSLVWLMVTHLWLYHRFLKSKFYFLIFISYELAKCCIRKERVITDIYLNSFTL